MEDHREGFFGCIIDMLEIIGLLIALSWPILILLFGGK